jgi:hypothetical protein
MAHRTPDSNRFELVGTVEKTWQGTTARGRSALIRLRVAGKTFTVSLWDDMARKAEELQRNDRVIVTGFLNLYRDRNSGGWTTGLNAEKVTKDGDTAEVAAAVVTPDDFDDLPTVDGNEDDDLPF